MPDFPDGEGPVDDLALVKARAKAERGKPEHHRPQDDPATQDGDIEDPGKQRKDDE